MASRPILVRSDSRTKRASSAKLRVTFSDNISTREENTPRNRSGQDPFSPFGFQEQSPNDLPVFLRPNLRQNHSISDRALAVIKPASLKSRTSLSQRQHTKTEAFRLKFSFRPETAAALSSPNQNHAKPKRRPFGFSLLNNEPETTSANPPNTRNHSSLSFIRPAGLVHSPTKEGAQEAQKIKISRPSSSAAELGMSREIEKKSSPLSPRPRPRAIIDQAEVQRFARQSTSSDSQVHQQERPRRDQAGGRLHPRQDQVGQEPRVHHQRSACG